MRVLFILKYREVNYSYQNCLEPDYSQNWAYTRGMSSGLSNSARFVSDMLNTVHGITSHLVHVTDNNDIDREVTEFKPTHVIIEAYWVVPEKFQILTKLHPNVKWIIRNHSNTPFLANEGIAFGWTIDYLKTPNVYVSCNHPLAHRDFGVLAGCVGPELIEKLIFLPNYYPTEYQHSSSLRKNKCTLDIGCFGAIRPLKNQMIQAIAAIEYAKQQRRHLRFHINGNRVEGQGGPILKNLRDLFSKISGADLIEHSWLDHEEFLDLIGTMDIGLQVSYTETFNIVAADFVACNIPIVVSSEVFWMNPIYYANPNNSLSIVNAMNRVTGLTKLFPRMNGLNRNRLNKYNEKSKNSWIQSLKSIS